MASSNLVLPADLGVVDLGVVDLGVVDLGVVVAF